MIVVYVSSPYTQGVPADNVHVQLEAAHRLMDLGCCPVAPLLSHFLHLVRPRSYEEWMACDLELVTRCDVVLRLPGTSTGADRETDRAKYLGIPVVYSWDELTRWINCRTVAAK